MNQRYGEQRDNGESQQFGESYRHGRYGQGQQDPQQGPGRFGQSERDREGYGREGHSGGGYWGSERYGQDPGRQGEGQWGRQGEGQGRGFGEGQRGQGYYSGGRFGEEGGRDYERSPYWGAMSYRDADPWRRESNRPWYGRREEYGYGGPREGYGGTGHGGMRSGYGPDWDYGQGTYGGRRYSQQGQYGEERYGERGWESGRGRGRGLVGRLFGRGPKGYMRSDERIKEDICEQLWRSDNVDSSEVLITVTEGEVVLAGTVPERWMRHEIENIADETLGVKDINNNIRIQRQSDTSQEASSAARGSAGTGMSTGTRTGTGTGAGSGTGSGTGTSSGSGTNATTTKQ